MAVLITGLPVSDQEHDVRKWIYFQAPEKRKPDGQRQHRPWQNRRIKDNGKRKHYKVHNMECEKPNAQGIKTRLLYSNEKN